MIDADIFRSTMRQLASGVIVITTRLGQRPHAMTATAFTPLSLDPPLVLVCIHRSNDTHSALSAETHFGINLLGEHQSALAGRFAGKSADRYVFDDVPSFAGPGGTMLLSGCAAVIEAERVETIDAGDHTIFIARIAWAQVQGSVEPLVYFRGAYQRLQPLQVGS